MKLCIDCKFYVCQKDSTPHFGKCSRKSIASPVDGSLTNYEELPYCSIERKDYDTQETCRLEAKYFVAKEQSGSPFNIEPLPLPVNLESNHV